MKLPIPGPRYEQRTEAARNREIEQADQRNVKTDRDSVLVGGRIILTSPNGSRHALVVSDSGVLSTVAAP